MDFAAFGQRLKIALAFIVEGESFMMRLQSRRQTPPPCKWGQGAWRGLAGPGETQKSFYVSSACLVAWHFLALLPSEREQCEMLGCVVAPDHPLHSCPFPSCQRPLPPHLRELPIWLISGRLEKYVRSNYNQICYVRIITKFSGS